MAVPSNLPPRKNVYQAAAEYRQRLLAREQDTVDDTVRRWLIARHQIEKELDQLIGRVEAALAAGKRPVVLPFGGNFGPDEFSASWLYRVGRLETLAATIEGELAKFNQDGLAKIASRAKTEVGAGELDAQNLLRFRVRDDGLISPRNFAALPTGALEQITAMVGPGGPLPKAFNGMSADLIQKVQQRLVDGIAKGENPRVVGRKMLQDTEDGGLLDTPLYKQVRVARTEPIRAYRESGRLTYLANSDVVTAWEWRAFPGRRTCPYCLAMDGSIHPLDQPMATHPQCRCTQLPVTELSDAPEFTGAEYLYRLSASEQDEVFGSHTMGELYRSGKVRLSDIPEQFQHEDWGRSGRAASLRSLQGRGVITQDDIVQARESRTARPVWSFAGTQPFQPTQFIPAVPSTAPVAPAPVQLPPVEVTPEQQAALLSFGQTTNMDGTETLKQFEAKARAQRLYESAAAYKDGKLVLMKDGEASSVGFSVEELQKLRGAILTHNHPASSSFSGADIALSVRWQLKEIRAVGQAFDYSMSGIPTIQDLTARGILRSSDVEGLRASWGAEDDDDLLAKIMQAYHQSQMDKLEAKYRKIVGSGKMLELDAWREHTHEAMKELARAFQVTYKRTKRKP